MSRSILAPVYAAWIAIAATAAVALADSPKAFVGGRILPIAADPIPNGVLVVEGKRILAIGAADQVAIPNDAQRIDARTDDPQPCLAQVGGGVEQIRHVEAIARLDIYT